MELFPPMPLTSWQDTKQTLHRFCVDGNPIFTIDFDFVDHQLRIHTLDGRAVAVPLHGQSVASFHDQTLQALAGLGISVAMAHPHPFDLPDADRPFADGTEDIAHTRLSDRHVDQPPTADPATPACLGGGRRARK